MFFNAKEVCTQSSYIIFTVMPPSLIAEIFMHTCLFAVAHPQPHLKSGVATINYRIKLVRILFSPAGG